MPKLTSTEAFVFLIQLISLLGLSKLLGELFRRFKQPAVIGEIIAGIILGPSILGILFPGAFHWLFHGSPGASIALDGTISLAVLFLLFVVGLEIDLQTMAKHSKVVGIVGGLGVIIPALLGGLFGWLIYPIAGELAISRELFAMFMGAALSISALPVIAKVLLDLDLLRTAVISKVVIGVATINDVVGWILFTLVLSLSGHTSGHISVTATIILTIVLALLSVTWLRTFMNWLLNQVNKFFPGEGSIIGVTIVAMLIASVFTEYIGIHSVFGAFVIGIAVNNSPHFSHKLREHINQFTLNILAPMFFAAVGLKINFFESFDLKMVLLVIAAAYVTKMAAGMIGGKLAGLSKNHAIGVSLGITARGGMGIILAIIALDAHLINPQIFEALVIMALVTSITAGLIKYYVKPDNVGDKSESMPQTV